ncbi:hypothetical protein [Schlesneria paludicola]|uniref:hypothetical protein n=1 Tax=Schlesneria paludicola TaxID=360056 RepID=UPI00029B47F0|nr:hypothetical protein [Schlesneria paludicola]
MEELDEIPSFPVFENTFDSMDIPGEIGVAVSRETTESRICLAVGKSKDGCRKYLLEGDPYQITESKVITPDEYDTFISYLEELPARNGMIAADVLDGEGYMVKWRTADHEFRFVLCNPNCLELDYYKRIGTKLAALFGNECIVKK